ncbi:type II toxin-antitoxin system VapC family toxin [Xylophilus sp. GW821-FHT01B05]
MQYLLDTNICIYIINERPAHVIQRFRQYHAGDIGISSLSAAELAFGVAKSGSQRNRMALEKFLAPLELVPFGDESLWHYADIRATLERQGRPIGSIDTLIAAHARALGCTLVTHKLREFERVPDLRLANWAEP